MKRAKCGWVEIVALLSFLFALGSYGYTTYLEFFRAKTDLKAVIYCLNACDEHTATFYNVTPEVNPPRGRERCIFAELCITNNGTRDILLTTVNAYIAHPDSLERKLNLATPMTEKGDVLSPMIVKSGEMKYLKLFFGYGVNVPIREYSKTQNNQRIIALGLTFKVTDPKSNVCQIKTRPLIHLIGTTGNPFRTSAYSGNFPVTITLLPNRSDD